MAHIYPESATLRPSFYDDLRKLPMDDRGRILATWDEWVTRGVGTITKHVNPASEEKFGFTHTLRSGKLWRITIKLEKGCWEAVGVLNRSDRKVYHKRGR